MTIFFRGVPQRAHVTACLLVLLWAVSVSAQTPTGMLRGQVTDPSGAAVLGATILLTTPNGASMDTTTNKEGGYEFKDLPPGNYQIKAVAEGFELFTQGRVAIIAGQVARVSIALAIKVEKEKVEVTDSTTKIDVNPANNANTITLQGKDLEALSDDPDELQSELQALAGPSAGPSGGQIYIDGFTGGQLPPKSSIREIRVNQNPFSAQYDKLGYGRIEIFTKPGTDKYHGQFFFNDSNSVFNSRNPYVFVKPSYNSEIFDGNLGGPINKKASFFLDASRRNMDDFSAISAIDPSQLPNPLTANSIIPRVIESISNPRTRTNFNPRIDVQLTPTNSFTARYQITHDSEQNSGLGTFSLPSIAYNLNETEHTVQLSDTQILSPRMVNETRFQFQREINHQLPLGIGPLVDVQQSFSFGQSSEGLVRTTQNNYELQNHTSLTAHNHLIKFGARMRR